MADHTGIEWTDATWNPVRGCSRVSAGCESCYAERQAIRHGGEGRPYEGLVRTVNGHPVWTGKIRTVPSMLDWPLRWRGSPIARRENRPSRIFVNSMSDLFHENVLDEFIDQVFAVTTLTCAPSLQWQSNRHTYQVLTKRPERMRKYLTTPDRDEAIGYAAMVIYEESGGLGECDYPAALIHGPGRAVQHPAVPTRPNAWPLPNVWLGVSVENQETADERIPVLLDTPAAVRWVSYEPALGPVSFLDYLYANLEPTGRFRTHNNTRQIEYRHDGPQENGINWLVVGGESGPGARACDVHWIRNTVRQCQEAGVACFVKQLGARPFSRFNALSIQELRAFGGRTSDTEPWSLTDRKGGDPAEWPRTLRVQEFPA